MTREIEARFFAGDVAASQVIRFDAVHRAGRPFFFDVEVILDEEIELEALVGSGAELAFGDPSAEPRRLFGIVDEATLIGKPALDVDAQGARYALRVVSRLALLARSVDSRIFQDMTVKDIVTSVLSRHGITDVAWRLAGTYPKRAYCVQYQESALAFVSRLLEHEGVYFFVEPSGDGELLVLADDSGAAAPIAGDPELPLRPGAGLRGGREAIQSLGRRERVRAGKFVLRDFDFERPKLDLTVTAEGGERTDLEVYDHPGGYVDPGDGQRLAKVRLEEEQALRRTVEIDSTCARIAVGQTLSITLAGEDDGDYFVSAVTYDYVHRGDGADEGSAPRHRAHASLVPASVRYRPARVTPIPFMDGPQTAIVVAPEGSAPEAIHTDPHGRCKVRFHWDREGPTDDKASCWMRVAQLQTSGSMMLPRVGWEVIVEFLEGDPDRPIITGKLYNGAMMPPYALPEGKTRTAIKTASTPGGGGSNEIRLEDKAGAEEIMIHAQHDMSVVAANDAKRSIGNNETIRIGNNASLEIGADQTTKITKGFATTVGGDQKVSIGGARKVEVNAVASLSAHGKGTTTVSGDQMEMDGNPLDALLALAAQAAEEFVASMADNAIAAVKAQVDGAIDQVMGPINALNAQVQDVASTMEAVASGDMGAIGGMVASASGIPGAGAFAAAIGGGGGPPAGSSGSAGESPTNAMASMASAAARDAIHQGAGMLGSALGLDAGGGGGASAANVAGPEGDVEGVDAEDRTKGPGHSIATVKGSHTETVGSMKVTAAVKSVDTTVTGKKTINVGAATVQLAVGDYAESVGGKKTEGALGLVVLTKGGESEDVSGGKTTMVGGAIVDKLQGTHSIEASGPATFIGAFHKIEAAGSITFRCGASEIVVADEGVTITSPLVSFLAPKIQSTKGVTEL